jgi:hypothetical protein
MVFELEFRIAVYSRHCSVFNVGSTVARKDCRPAEKINQKDPKHCTYLILLPILSAYLLFMLWIVCDYISVSVLTNLSFITSVSQFLKSEDKI